MGIGKWILSFVLMAIEEWGAVYFFDIFMERKRKGWLDKCRQIVLYFICVPAAVLGGHFDVMVIKVLLKEGNMQAAAGLAERLTESISVEMSAVNTNHAVVNAVLNQKFYAAREQEISMIFRVGDMIGMRLDGEEKVILLSNLLDNAIHERVKVVSAGRKAVINIKLVQEDGKMIFSVKNPVAEKVQVVDGIVLDSGGGMHGVGLMNAKAVVDKYGGDFTTSCDPEKFHAVVMIYIF